MRSSHPAVCLLQSCILKFLHFYRRTLCSETVTKAGRLVLKRRGRCELLVAVVRWSHVWNFKTQAPSGGRGRKPKLNQYQRQQALLGLAQNSGGCCHHLWRSCRTMREFPMLPLFRLSPGNIARRPLAL